jgi:restriction endonuclease S subunit
LEKQSFGSANFFSKNTVLYPKLRPYLNKVYFAEFDGVCSTEFHVLDSKVEGLTNDFLSAFLRSQLVVSQTKCLMSGNTQPKLQTQDIENLLIPLPPLEK